MKSYLKKIKDYDILYHCWEQFYKYGAVTSAILFGVVAFCNYNSCNFKYEDWIGTQSLPFQISIVIMPFILGIKSIILTLDKSQYRGLLLLDAHKKAKNGFYNVMDKCVYVSCFIVIINVLKSVVLFNMLEKWSVILSVSATFFLIASLINTLRCLYNINQLNSQALNQNS